MQESRCADARYEMLLAESRRLKTRESIAFQRQIKVRHTCGRDKWLSFIFATRFLALLNERAENIEEMRISRFRQNAAAKRIQSAWKKFNCVSALGDSVQTAQAKAKQLKKTQSHNQEAAIIIHKFLIDCGSHIMWNRIRFHVFGHSMRGKVIMLQRWWKQKMLRRSLILGKLIHQWKTVEKALLKEEEMENIMSPNLKSPLKSTKVKSPSKTKARALLSPAIKRLRKLHVMRQVCSPTSTRRISREQREKIILEIYQKRREAFRQKMKEHSREMAQYRKQNKMNLQMNEMRKSLGLPPDPKFQVNVHPRPEFKWELATLEMRKIIVDTRKAITMKKLQDIVKKKSENDLGQQ